MGNKMTKEEIHRKYIVKEKLGSGSFAVVKLAERRADGEKFAVKVIKKSKLKAEEVAVVHEEVDVMRKIKHPNCVKLYEVFETNKKLYMVLELLTGGELFDRIVAKGSYSESEASAAIGSVNSAILYLHSIGITHRDLKPENLIYSTQKSDAVIKVTDFGLAKYNRQQGHRMHTACGTPGYVAPEVLKNEEYGSQVDMWSMGVILYILLCGFPPFYHESTTALYKQIKKGEFDFPDPYWTEVSDSAKNLVRKLLTVDPKRRFTPAQVKAHPWISGGTASTAPLAGDHSTRFKILRARRVMRRGVKAIIGVNRLAKALRNIQARQK